MKFGDSTDATGASMWTRLGSNERDQHQSQFHPACQLHRYVGSFEVGVRSG